MTNEEQLETLFLQQTLQQCVPAFYGAEGLAGEDYLTLATVFDDLLVAREGTVAVE
jgi:hypothetical protein